MTLSSANNNTLRKRTYPSMLYPRAAARLVCVALVALILLSSQMLPNAALAEPVPKLWLDGAILNPEVPPIIVNQRVLVPLGFLAKFFGVHAEWNQERRTAYLFFADGRQVALAPMDHYVWIWRQRDDLGNWDLEKKVVLDVAPRAVDGRIMVPLGFIVQHMGLHAEWDAQQYMVRITSEWYGKYDPSFVMAADLLPSLDVQSTHPEIVALASEITRELQDDREKLIAIHDWVAANIRYDVEDLPPPVEKPQDALSTLRRRSGVCTGYSNLTAALLRASGVPAKVIEGWARDPDETWAELLNRCPEADFPDGNHAWNEVFVDGRWVSVDVTWDAGYLKDGTFFADASRRYLDPPREIFENDHSKEKPSIAPPDPDHYYFRLSENDKKAVTRVATSYAFSLPGEGHDTLWYFPPVGLKDGPDIKAYQLICFGKDTEQEKMFLIECLRTATGVWRILSCKEVPPDYLLPTGAYEYRADWDR